MDDHDPLSVQLVIASRYEFLDVVQQELERLADRVGLEEDARHSVGIAVRESIANAIKHGNRGDAAKSVRVRLEVASHHVEVRVQDEGLGFNPQDVPDPLADENLLKAEGRGIFLMRTFMDDVRYDFPAGDGTLVTMIKRV